MRQVRSRTHTHAGTHPIAIDTCMHATSRTRGHTRAHPEIGLLIRIHMHYRWLIRTHPWQRSEGLLSLSKIQRDFNETFKRSPRLASVNLPRFSFCANNLRLESIHHGGAAVVATRPMYSFRVCAVGITTCEQSLCPLGGGVGWHRANMHECTAVSCGGASFKRSS